MSLVRHVAFAFSTLSPSAGSRRRARTRSRNPAQGGRRRERGVALVIVLSAIAILAVLLADMHENTGTGFAVATSERDRVQAEYMAKSGLNLTRLLIKEEPRIRMIVAPLYQMMAGRPPPQLPIWRLANELLQPFCNYDDAAESFSSLGSDLRSAQGLEGLPGTCEIVAVAENSKINVNSPLFSGGDIARRSIAMQVFSLLGGHVSPSPYDPLFSNLDADGQYTSRLDVISALIDWWDQDTTRTVFDPGRNTVTTGGPEDDLYARLDDPYPIKNAPFDSLEELRMIRGIGDDFWATFVEPDPDDPDARLLTIYGSGSVNPNEAPPEVLLGRLCSFVPATTLCADPMEGMKFVQLLRTARSMIPVPFFTTPADFLNFVQGRGGERDLYPMLLGFLGPGNPLVFTPILIPPEAERELSGTFVTSAQILSLHVTGFAGRAKVRLRTVVNFHDRWTPPPPNAGGMPSLGIFHHYRID